MAIAATTDTGRKRSHNEDNVGDDIDRGIAIVADGMGGHKGGATASQLAVDTALQRLAQGLDSGVGDGDASGFSGESVLVREAVEQSNRVIHDKAAQSPQYEGMGTTVVAAVFYEDQLSLAHVGDARAYRLRDGRLEQLTRDHTLMQELIERGFYTPEEARESLNRNVVTRALGIEREVQVDLQEDLALPGDLYLLCSDGLNDMLDDDTIRLTLADVSDNLTDVANSLIEQANENGGQDNVSAVLVRVLHPVTKRRSWLRRFVDWLQ
ncbi:MAG: Stp1/IreP family PP2C-type Ser/Thr phosphatase [Proteobacteria bacterium SW_6_67_9]|nr:MAG: Stp1/IreP family PP2C-type Ser/Thr phosphatase [Proteobacteria bacterium SW_6_67_9]